MSAVDGLPCLKRVAVVEERGQHLWAGVANHRVRGDQFVAGEDRADAGQVVGGVPGGVAVGRHRDRVAGEVERARVGERLGAGDADFLRDADPHDPGQPGQHPGSPEVRGDVQRGGLLEVVAVSVAYLDGVGVDGRAVAVVEVVGRAHVVDVRVGEQDGVDVLGAPADRPQRLLDAGEVAGVAGVDQRDGLVVADQVPVDLGALARNTSGATSSTRTATGPSPRVRVARQQGTGRALRTREDELTCSLLSRGTRTRRGLLIPITIIDYVMGSCGRRAIVARSKDVRAIVRLVSSAGTGYAYVTNKSRRNDPDRLVLRKYDPVVGQHVDFREAR